MPWAKFDDRFNQHPKVIAAGPLAIALHMRAIVYSAQYLTDGVIRRRTLRHIIDWGDDEDDFGGRPPSNIALAKRLVNAALWEEAGDGEGWVIHDYLDYNPSREDAERLKAARTEAGRKGGRSKGSPEASAQALALAKAQASALASAKHGLSKVPVVASGRLGGKRTGTHRHTKVDGATAPDPLTAVWAAQNVPMGRPPAKPSENVENVPCLPDPAQASAQASAKQVLGTCLPFASDMSEAKRKPVPVPEPVPPIPSVRSNTPSEPASSPGPRAVPAKKEGNGPAVMLPLVAGHYTVSHHEADELAAVYPGVDVPGALVAMRRWCLANPRRRKTEHGIQRFISGWLAREVEKGSQGYLDGRGPITPTPGGHLGDAWAEVLRLATNSSGEHSDPVARETIRMMGGGQALGRMQAKELQVHGRRTFMELYPKAAQKLGEEGSICPHGPSSDEIGGAVGGAS